LELFEIDFQRGTGVLQCQKCGVYHFYRKRAFGRWKLLKATKVFEQFKKIAEGEGPS